MNTALVWLKRDLRTDDHLPLAEARLCDRALAVFIIEPQALAGPEFDPQHLAFALACLQPLQRDLARQGLPLLVQVGEAVPVLEALRRAHGVTHLFSHEETGPGWTYDRDRAVARWARATGVPWREFPQTGVQRRQRSRAGWAGRWARRMNTPPLPAAAGTGLAAAWMPPDTLRLADLPPLPSLAGLGLPPARPLPAAGEAAAHVLLESFLAGRGRDYHRGLSSPLTAPTSCSRLSAHLAFGTVSMRRVHQATQAAIASHTAAGDRDHAHALRGFAGRLRWHCHFMQKLEDEPEIEFRNFSRAHDGLRPGDVPGGSPPMNGCDHERLAAWCEGRTGYPMVDACMRQLHASGWLNFRMRAMLVSFAAYHLWLHWREPGQFLARQFLDFEAGIHWSQMQMQSGTTGINTLRIYSPAKQARDHDPDGHYCHRWIPELGSPAYPPPIVDEPTALAHAKDKLYALRRSPAARSEADRIQDRHGSRKSGLPPSSRPRPARRPREQPEEDPGEATQGRLFD